MQIQISWLRQKPTDLELHGLQRHGVSGFNRKMVNYEQRVIPVVGMAIKTRFVYSALLSIDLSLTLFTE